MRGKYVKSDKNELNEQLAGEIDAKIQKDYQWMVPTRQAGIQMFGIQGIKRMVREMRTNPKQ